MKRKEIIVLTILIAILILINIVKYLNQLKNNTTYAMIIEESINQISINYANADEIEKLPGIGPSLAQRIVEYRTKNGRFKEPGELKKVKGIGDKLFDKIQPFIKL